MRALLPEPADPVDVHDWYARNWLDPGGVRVNFIESVDGAVSVAGASRGLQTPGDNRVFAAMRDLADVIVAGAGTVIKERYGPVQPSGRRERLRTRYGLQPVPPIAVVSRSLNFDETAPLFTEAAVRTIVLTCAAADPGRRRALGTSADVLLCGEDEVDAGRATAALNERGLTRIVCEGGPVLFADWAGAGVVTELCLTLCPLLAGPGAGRIVGGRSWPGPRPLTLTGVLEEDGALFCRYRSC